MCCKLRVVNGESSTSIKICHNHDTCNTNLISGECSREILCVSLHSIHFLRSSVGCLAVAVGGQVN